MRIPLSRPNRASLAAFAALAVVAAGLPLLASSAAAAGSYVVDDPGDGVDATPGDGICATASEVCTLRAAVGEGQATGGTTSITFDPGTTTVALGDPSGIEDFGSMSIDSTVIITGSLTETGSTIVQAGLLEDRHFVVGGTGRLELHDVNLTGGDAGTGDGGAILNSGSVLITGTPTDTRTTSAVLTGNRAANGGAIANSGTVEIRNDSVASVQTRVDISGNSATVNGGAFLNSGTLTFTGQTAAASHDIYADNNTATGDGGTLVNTAGQATIGCRAYLRFATASTGGNLSVTGGTVSIAGGGLDGGTATSVNGGGGAHVGAAGLLRTAADADCREGAQISRSTATFASGRGGGVAVLGRLEVAAGTNLSVSGAESGRDAHFGGGISVDGDGVVEVDGRLDIGRTAATYGGGLRLGTPNAVVRTGSSPARISVIDSTATAAGGGISVGEGTLDARVDLFGNTAPTGGGLSLALADDLNPGVGASVTLEQSRLVANTATTGAAIHLAQYDSELSVTNSTIADNVSDAGGVVDVSDGDTALSFVTVVDNSPVGVAADAPVQLRGALLAANGTSNCSGSDSVLSGGAFNLADDTSCHPNGTDIDLPSRYGELRSLLDEVREGEFIPAESHPAIDALTGAAGDSVCAGIVADQRNSPRPVDGDGDGIAACDVGAIEVSGGSDEDDETWPVSGTVWDETTRRPLRGVCVFAASIDDPDDGGMFVTDSQGRWAADATDGSYLVGFFMPAEPVDPDEDRDDGKNSCGETGFSPDYQAEWYRNVAIEIDDDSPVFPAAGEIELVVVDGAAVTGIDACLGPGPGPGLDAPCGPPVEPTTTTTTAAPGAPPTDAGGSGAARAAGSRTPSRLAFVG